MPASSTARRWFFVALAAALLAMLLLIRPPAAPRGDAGTGSGAAAALAHQARTARSPAELRRLLLPPSAPATPGDAAANSTAPAEQSLARLVSAFQRLTEEERTRVAEELVAELEDEQFPALLPLLTHPAMPIEVLDVLMADALGRRNSLCLPALLEVARVAGHPRAEDARDFLMLYLDADHGTDWTAWQTTLSAWLAVNPD